GSRDPHAPRGLRIVDVATATSAWIEHPSPSARKQQTSLLFPVWSADGAEILMLASFDDGDRKRREYHAYHVGESRFERIDGSFDRQGTPHFRRGRAEIPTFWRAARFKSHVMSAGS